jgi:hypothetical protein
MTLQLPNTVVLRTPCLTRPLPVSHCMSCLQRCFLTLLPAAAADYQLLVYGSLTFDAGYVERCRGLVMSLGLTNNVELRGLGKPTAVLAQGWCYLQVSSRSWGVLQRVQCGMPRPALLLATAHAPCILISLSSSPSAVVHQRGAAHQHPGGCALRAVRGVQQRWRLRRAAGRAPR